MEKIGDESNELQQITQKVKLKMNGNSGMAGAVYSPKASTTSKSKAMKKANSSLQHGYQSTQPTSGLSQHNNKYGNEMNNESETEKILLSNDKVTVKDLWNSAPNPDIPSFFLQRLDLDALIEETT